MSKPAKVKAPPVKAAPVVKPKIDRAARAKRLAEKKAACPPKVERGTARRLRRELERDLASRQAEIDRLRKEAA